MPYHYIHGIEHNAASEEQLIVSIVVDLKK